MFSVPKRAVHMQGAMESIMLLLLVAGAFVGELITLAVLWPYGALVALVGAQLGATALVLMAGALLAAQRAKVGRKQGAAFRLPSRA